MKSKQWNGHIITSDKENLKQSQREGFYLMVLK